MTDHDRRHHDEQDERDRPRVRVTDKRRVKVDDSDAPGPESSPIIGEPEASRSGGPSASEASRGSEAPPANAEPRAAGVGDEIDAVRAEAVELREHLQRLAAEFDNYRKRVLKEQTR